MRILFRNPLLRALAQFWWAPVLAALLLGLTRGQSSLGWAGVGAYLGVLAGVLGVSWMLVRLAVSREQGRHRAAGHRFLCPACLNADTFRYACPSCRKEIEAPHALAGDLLGAACPGCAAAWTPGAGAAGGLRSYCSHCKSTDDPAVLHERAVKVRGALTGGDFDTLRACGSEPERSVAGVRCLVRDDGTATVWTLCLEDLTRDQELLPQSHALHGLAQIWTSESDPLRMGQIVDHLVSRAELSEAQLAGMSIAVAGAGLDPAAQRLLSTRFGSVEVGVSAHQFAGTAAARAAVTPPAAEAREAAVLGAGGSRHGGTG